tara:strand:+ start:122 stop:271 length:150 start_codon:yes stop_codon:yes gene_type:complete
LHIRVATLEDPESVTPTADVCWSEHLAWLEIGNTLKKLETTGTAPEKEH